MSEGEVKNTIEEEFGNETDDDFQEDQDRIADELYKDLNRELVDQLKEMNSRLADLERTVNLTIDQRMVFDDVETRYNEIKERFRTRDAKYERQKEKTKKQKDKLAEQNRSNRSKMRTRVILVLIGVSVLGGVIFYLIKMDQDKQPVPSDDFTQADADEAKTLLEQWRSKSDAEFWASVADYVAKQKPSMQSQMTMMAYVKNWATAAEVDWGDTEKGDDIETLIGAAGSGYDKIYSTVVTLKHKDKAFERAVAADLCENAVANLLAESDDSGGGS